MCGPLGHHQHCLPRPCRQHMPKRLGQRPRPLDIINELQQLLVGWHTDIHLLHCGWYLAPSFALKALYRVATMSAIHCLQKPDIVAVSWCVHVSMNRTTYAFNARTETSAYGVMCHDALAQNFKLNIVGCCLPRRWPSTAVWLTTRCGAGHRGPCW